MTCSHYMLALITGALEILCGRKIHVIYGVQKDRE